MAQKNHGQAHRGTVIVPLILLADVVQSGWWCCCVSLALSSTGAITTDVRGVTEGCFFDHRRGCSRGNRGSRASLQQYQFWMQDKQLQVEAQDVSSSVEARWK